MAQNDGNSSDSLGQDIMLTNSLCYLSPQLVSDHDRLYGQSCYARAKEAQGLVAVVATLSKGHDLTSGSSTSHTICYSATPGRL
jgi:hypothetical protein